MRETRRARGRAAQGTLSKSAGSVRPGALAGGALSLATRFIQIGHRALSWLVGTLGGAVAALARLALAVLRSVAALLSPLPRASAWALRMAEREVRPARALAVVAVGAGIALGGSQFSDYRAVEIGAPEYRSVEGLTPAPQLARESPRSAHGAWVLAIAIASVLVTALAVTRNWRLARLLIFLGAAVIPISLLVDAPPGLREGDVGIAYQGAHAILLGGFWVQLSSGVTLMVVGPLLALQLRDERDARRARRRERRQRRGASSSSLGASPPGSGMEEAAT